MLYIVVEYKIGEEIDRIIIHQVIADDFIVKFKKTIKDRLNGEEDVVEMISMTPYTCYGCAYDCSGQRDHMDEGGCLQS